MSRQRRTLLQPLLRGPRFFAPLFALALGLAMAFASSDPAAASENKPEDLLKQWYKLKTVSADTGRAAELVGEGERILLRLQELEDLRRDVLGMDRQDYYQRVARLQERFNYLLFQLEMARLSTLPDEEIDYMREYYEEERQGLLAEIRAIEDSIIVRGERFLDTYRMQIALKHYASKSEMVVDFIYRLAEIYYRRAEEIFFSTGDIGAFDPAIEKYQRILDEFPTSGYVDDALYNIAYLKNSSPSPEDRLQACILYSTLIDHYPDSPFRPEAYWRLAEYHFNQDPPQTEEAIAQYAKLENYPETNWYARSLYKIGWCHFIDSEYPQAVNYFARTVETSLNNQEESRDVLAASMMDEAVEYISVCFAQDPEDWPDSGVEAALAFVSADSLRRQIYGGTVLDYLGDIYRDQVGKYHSAIEAYEAYLDLYAYDSWAPWVREKIINCYAIHLREIEQAFIQKDNLFGQFWPGSEWHRANEDPELQAAADNIVEKYAFQNVNESISRAIESKKLSALQLAAQRSRAYLEAYPTGANAYTVNYNLAVLLDQYLADDAGAYAEYTKVAKDSTDAEYRELAAVNAVVIARKMIASEGEKPLFELLDTPLSQAERMYVDAIDNYLNYHPQGEKAEQFLLNAGSIYYNHGSYPQSREYYDRLIAGFPEGERRADAYRYIMNGYFSEGNFAEAERVSKEIQAIGFDSTHVAVARMRQAESIFLHAQELKKEGDLIAAAQEYRRAVLETPEFGQGDKALFESGLAYQQATAWTDANSVYLLLVDTYPASDLADKALYNVAYNYHSELGDAETAALYYERLAREYPSSRLAEDALRSASVNYVNAGEWAGAIRINNLYVAQFPDAPDANIFLFENAGLYLKLGDEENANSIYASFAKRFPDDPRAVRAHWERGQYFLAQARTQQAGAEFAAGWDLHSAMVLAGGNGEETYASRCLLELIHAGFSEYQAIQIAPPDVEGEKRIKLARRDELLELCAQMNSLAKDEMFEGLYTIGLIDEELSLAFAGQAIPALKSAEETILAREGANQDAIEIALRAIERYGEAALSIDVAAQILRRKETELEQGKAVLSSWIIAAGDAASPPAGLTDSITALTALEHSLEEVWKAASKARDWARRSREKQVDLALRNAELKYATVQEFLNLPDVGETEEMEMVYRSALLAEFAAPRAGDAEEYYLNAWALAENSGNETARQENILQGVARIYDAFGSEFGALGERALILYSENARSYQDLLKKGEGAVTASGFQAAEIAEKLVLYSDYSYEFTVTALAVTESLIGIVADGADIPAEFGDRLAASALENILDLNQRYGDLTVAAREQQMVAEAKQEESVLWEDAAMTWEDCAYNFGGRQAELLKLALQFNRSRGNDPALAQRLGWALIEVDRDTDLSVLAEYGTEYTIRSDTGFLTSTTFHPVWDGADFADADWNSAVDVRMHLGDDEALAASRVIWAAPGVDMAYPDTVYIRKNFEIDGEPVYGEIWIRSRGSFSLLVNGDFVGAEDFGSGLTNLHRYDIARSLSDGKNSIAVLAIYEGSARGGVALALNYKVFSGKQAGSP